MSPTLPNWIIAALHRLDPWLTAARARELLLRYDERFVRDFRRASDAERAASAAHLLALAGDARELAPHADALARELAPDRRSDPWLAFVAGRGRDAGDVVTMRAAVAAACGAVADPQAWFTAAPSLTAVGANGCRLLRLSMDDDAAAERHASWLEWLLRRVETRGLLAGVHAKQGEELLPLDEIVGVAYSAIRAGDVRFLSAVLRLCDPVLAGRPARALRLRDRAAILTAAVIAERALSALEGELA